MASSSSSPSQPSVATTLLDLPELLLGRHIVAHPALDGPARLALFRSCHALARMVLLHAPSSKRVTLKASNASRTSDQWSKLEHLFGIKWQPLPPQQLDLDLCVEPSAPLLPPKPPPTSMTHHVLSLHLYKLRLTIPHLAAWHLHDPARWPHLQHLTIQLCGLPKAIDALPQQPIPRLLSFTWTEMESLPQHDAGLHVARDSSPSNLPWCVLNGTRSMPRLTHVRLDVDASSFNLRVLLEHPTLEHVRVDSVNKIFGLDDLSKQPCRWKTFSVARGMPLSCVAKLPLGGLERLTVALVLGEPAAYEGVGSGVAALQPVHRRGKLALLPPPGRDNLRWQPGARDRWCLARSVELFDLTGAGASTYALLRLVVEAGQGMHTVMLDASALPLTLLREALAPAMLRQPGTLLHMLCLYLDGSVTDVWCAGVLGVLPPCITHVRVVKGHMEFQRLVSLVQGGVEGLRHAVHLTVLHRGSISAEEERGLRHLAAGDGGGAGQGQRGLLLTLKVVWGD